MRVIGFDSRRRHQCITVFSDHLWDGLGLDGVVIHEVLRNSPAERAGFKGIRRSRSGRIVLGDQIVGVDDQLIRSNEDLLYPFEQAGVGARWS